MGTPIASRGASGSTYAAVARRSSTPTGNVISRVAVTRRASTPTGAPSGVTLASPYTGTSARLGGATVASGVRVSQSRPTSQSVDILRSSSGGNIRQDDQEMHRLDRGASVLVQDVAVQGTLEVLHPDSTRGRGTTPHDASRRIPDPQVTPTPHRYALRSRTATGGAHSVLYTNPAFRTEPESELPMVVTHTQPDQPMTTAESFSLRVTQRKEPEITPTVQVRLAHPPTPFDLMSSRERIAACHQRLQDQGVAIIVVVDSRVQPDVMDDPRFCSDSIDPVLYCLAPLSGQAQPAVPSQSPSPAAGVPLVPAHTSGHLPAGLSVPAVGLRPHATFAVHTRSDSALQAMQCTQALHSSPAPVAPPPPSASCFGTQPVSMPLAEPLHVPPTGMMSLVSPAVALPTQPAFPYSSARGESSPAALPSSALLPLPGQPPASGYPLVLPMDPTLLPAYGHDAMALGSTSQPVFSSAPTLSEMRTYPPPPP